MKRKKTTATSEQVDRLDVIHSIHFNENVLCIVLKLDKKSTYNGCTYVNSGVWMYMEESERGHHRVVFPTNFYAISQPISSE